MFSRSTRPRKSSAGAAVGAAATGSPWSARHTHIESGRGLLSAAQEPATRASQAKREHDRGNELRSVGGEHARDAIAEGVSDDESRAVARVRDAMPWKKAADAAGIRWLCFDDDTGEKKLPNATKKARDHGLPAVVLIGKAGLAEAVKVPETPEGMENLVKKGGAK